MGQDMGQPSDVQDAVYAEEMYFLTEKTWLVAKMSFQELEKRYSYF